MLLVVLHGAIISLHCTCNSVRFPCALLFSVPLKILPKCQVSTLTQPQLKREPRSAVPRTRPGTLQWQVATPPAQGLATHQAQLATHLLATPRLLEHCPQGLTAGILLLLVLVATLLQEASHHHLPGRLAGTLLPQVQGATKCLREVPQGPQAQGVSPLEHPMVVDMDHPHPHPRQGPQEATLPIHPHQALQGAVRMNSSGKIL